MSDNSQVAAPTTSTTSIPPPLARETPANMFYSLLRALTRLRADHTAHLEAALKSKKSFEEASSQSQSLAMERTRLGNLFLEKRCDAELHRQHVAELSRSLLPVNQTLRDLSEPPADIISQHSGLMHSMAIAASASAIHTREGLKLTKKLNKYIWKAERAETTMEEARIEMEVAEEKAADLTVSVERLERGLREVAEEIEAAAEEALEDAVRGTGGGEEDVEEQIVEAAEDSCEAVREVGEEIGWDQAPSPGAVEAVEPSGVTMRAAGDDDEDGEIAAREEAVMDGGQETELAKATDRLRILLLVTHILVGKSGEKESDAERA